MPRSGYVSMAEPRWEISEEEREQLANAKEFGARDVIRAFRARPSLAARAVRAAVSGAKRGVCEDSSVVWYLSAQRMREVAPGAATGALWYGEEAFLTAAEPYLNSECEALEIGGGTGRITRLVAPRVKQVACTDISEPLLEEAAVNLAGIDNVEYRLADGAAVDSAFGRARFDLAFSHDVFVAIDPDPAVAILISVARALRPGGHMVASFFTVDRPADRSVQTKLVSESARKGWFGVSHPRTYVAEQIDAMFEMAGFEVVDRAYAEVSNPDHRPHFMVTGKVSE